jgi:hypothetical protein
MMLNCHYLVGSRGINDEPLQSKSA